MRLDDADEWEPGNAGYGQLSGREHVSQLGRGTRQGTLWRRSWRALSRPPSAKRFWSREEELTQSLAAHLGASLDNLTVFQERSRVAQALQQTLLPPVLPDVEGVDVAVRYRPAKSSSLVGGDFYDMFEARSDVWGLMIGDVTGVGPEAAALTGIARYAARALAAQEHSPARLLTQLNETLVGFGLQDRFCTVLYAELHPGPDVLKIKIANGGHPYPYILRSDGHVEEIAISGTLLGLLSDVAFEELELVLGPGRRARGLHRWRDRSPQPDRCFFRHRRLSANTARLHRSAGRLGGAPHRTGGDRAPGGRDPGRHRHRGSAGPSRSPH